MEIEITQEMVDAAVRASEIEDIKVYLTDALEDLSHINIPHVAQCREKIMEAIFWLEA